MYKKDVETGAEIGKVRRRFRPLGLSQEEQHRRLYHRDGAAHTHTYTQQKKGGRRRRSRHFSGEGG